MFSCKTKYFAQIKYDVVIVDLFFQLHVLSRMIPILIPRHYIIYWWNLISLTGEGK